MSKKMYLFIKRDLKLKTATEVFNWQKTKFTIFCEIAYNTTLVEYFMFTVYTRSSSHRVSTEIIIKVN